MRPSCPITLFSTYTPVPIYPSVAPVFGSHLMCQRYQQVFSKPMCQKMGLLHFFLHLDVCGVAWGSFCKDGCHNALRCVVRAGWCGVQYKGWCDGCTMFSMMCRTYSWLRRDAHCDSRLETICGGKLSAMVAVATDTP